MSILKYKAFSKTVSVSFVKCVLKIGVFIVKNTVNDNEIVSIETAITMNNDNDRKFDRSKKVEYIADKLVETFNNKQFRGFYCKVAWKLSEARIWDNVEQSQKGTSPARLFTYLCKRDGV